MVRKTHLATIALAAATTSLAWGQDGSTAPSSVASPWHWTTLLALLFAALMAVAAVVTVILLCLRSWRDRYRVTVQASPGSTPSGGHSVTVVIAVTSHGARPVSIDSVALLFEDGTDAALSAPMLSRGFPLALKQGFPHGFRVASSVVREAEIKAGMKIGQVRVDVNGRRPEYVKFSLSDWLDEPTAPEET